MSAASILGQLLIGWLLADMLAGLAHWFEDRVLRESRSWIGRTIVAPNRRHHREPAAFLVGSFLDRNLTTIVTAAIGSLIWIMLFGVSLVWLSATIAGMGASMAHYWAHDPRSGGKLVRALQEIGLLQSPAHHAGHHRPPSDRRYCPISNWVNPVLDGLDVWGRAERVLRRLGVRMDVAQ